MKNTFNFTLLVFSVLFLLSSCKVSRYIAPPFTDVDKIMKLRSGIGLSEVNTTLGIKPYDIIHSYETGSKILIFNYRVKDRNMVLASRTANRTIHSEEAQKEGETWYNTNHKEIYLLFKNDTLSGIYGERMFSEGAYLEMVHERLAFEEIRPKTNNVDLAHDRDYLFLQNVYQERSALKEKAMLQEDEEVKKRRKILTYGAGLALLTLLSLISR